MHIQTSVLTVFTCILLLQKSERVLDDGYKRTERVSSIPIASVHSLLMHIKVYHKYYRRVCYQVVFKGFDSLNLLHCSSSLKWIWKGEIQVVWNHRREVLQALDLVRYVMMTPFQWCVCASCVLAYSVIYRRGCIYICLKRLPKTAPF